jgi:hypothetical protein
MQSWSGRFAVLTLLLVLPLQGVAATLSHLLCSSSPAVEHMSSGQHHDGGNDDGIAREHESSDTGPGHAGHLSCHQVSSAPPTLSVMVFAGDLPVYEPAIFSAPSLFVPEQPQRPPLA